MAGQPDIQILTQVLETFSRVFGTGKGALLPWSMYIAGTLAVIEMVLLGAFHALKGGDESVLPKLIKKILTIGFFVFLVTGVATGGLADVILKGFVAVGMKASGTSMSFSMKDPSGIIVAGFQAAEPIMQAIDDMDMLAVGDKIIAFLCYVGVLAGYFIMAFQVLITFIEWGIVSTLGIILLPFGISKHTAFLSEKAIGAIIAFGVKLMVLAFIIGVIQPIILAIPTLGPDPTWEQMIGLFITTLAIGLIVAQAPGVAASVLSGSPALTSSVATAGALGAAAAGVGGVAASGAAATGVGAAVMGAAGAAAKLGGVVSGAKAAAGSDAGQEAGATTAGVVTGMAASSLKGAMGGNAFQKAKGAATAAGMEQITGQPSSSLQTGPAESGSNTATPAAGGGNTSNTTGGGGSPSTPAPGSSPPGGTGAQPNSDKGGSGRGSSLRQGMQDVNAIKGAAPNDASPSAGADFRIQQGGED